MIFEITQGENAASLFQGWQEPMIWACLQGVMGRLYGDSAKAPSSAMALLGDFCFLAGKPNRELVLYKPQCCGQDFVIMVPGDGKWAALIENCYGMEERSRAKKVLRYGIRKEPDIFTEQVLEKLRKAVEALPEEYELRMMDETLFWRCREIPWCRDWVYQYEDYDRYRKYGMGAVILKDGEPVSGASSYAGCDILGNYRFTRGETYFIGERDFQGAKYFIGEEYFQGAKHFIGEECSQGAKHAMGEECSGEDRDYARKADAVEKDYREAAVSRSIEVEIDTRQDYRRRGLAYICGAKLILECRKRGWYPSWDAQNLWSAALAEKLGYHFDQAYIAYEILGW